MALTAVLFFHNCTDTELCEEESTTSHSHLSAVTFDYIWDENNQPDSMAIFAVRIVNLWKCGIKIDTHPYNQHLCGLYFHPTDQFYKSFYAEDVLNSFRKNPINKGTGEDDVPDINISTDPEDPNNGIIDPNQPIDSLLVKPQVKDTLHTFPLKQGEYKIITFNMDSVDVVFEKAYDYIKAEGHDVQLTDITVKYKTYPKESLTLPSIVSDWVDYNPGFNYIHSNSNPVYYDSVELTKIEKNTIKQYTFHPHRITQNIDIYFDIKKDRSLTDFVIDTVIGEISGIPSSVQLTTGHLKLSKTNKMMFNTELVNENGAPIGSDSYQSDQVRIHGNIDVLSIVHSDSQNDITGPGIMQVIIVVTARDAITGELRHKRIQGKINLYNTLIEADLFGISDNGKYAYAKKRHAVLDIHTGITIDANHMTNSSSETGGLDEWQPMPGGDIYVEM